MSKLLEASLSKQEESYFESQNVSRETFLNFSKYFELLQKWNSTINLVSNSTLPEFWTRHIIDSMQIYPHIKEAKSKSLSDLGSGAGFPGLVLAIMGLARVDLVESDSRKCSFLREAVRQLGLSGVQVHNQRIEDMTIKSEIITARALAPLSKLLEYAQPLLQENGECFFLKGEDYRDEIDIARQKWQFSHKTIPSQSGSAGIILSVRGIQNV